MGRGWLNEGMRSVHAEWFRGTVQKMAGWGCRGLGSWIVGESDNLSISRYAAEHTGPIHIFNNADFFYNHCFSWPEC